MKQFKGNEKANRKTYGLLDAYDDYCSINRISSPSKKMRAKFKQMRHLRFAEVTDENLAEMHRIRQSIVKLTGTEEPTGYGDRFDAFCVRHGRERPTTEQIERLNEDPYIGAQEIRMDPTRPMLYRALVTFTSRGGMRNVRPL